MKEKENKIQEMQFLEHNLQNLLLQKQAFQMELTETQSAIKEIDNSGEEVFKIVGQLMIKSDKSTIKKELSEKEKMLEIRMKTLETQEKSFSEKVEGLRKQILGK